MKKVNNLSKEYKYTLLVLTVELLVSITQALSTLQNML